MASQGYGLAVVDISLADLVKVTSTLENIVFPSFGPACQPTLMTTNTGQVVFTKDGYTILSALSMSHPIAKCILDTVFSHANVYGDGCKALILFLSELFRGIERNSDVLFCDSNGKNLKSGISLSLHKFINEELTLACDSLLHFVKENSSPCVIDFAPSKSSLEAVIGSVLTGSFPEDVVKHLVSLLSDFAVSLEPDVHKRTVLDMFFQTCVHIFPNKSYLSSFASDALYFHGVFGGQQVRCNKKSKMVLSLCTLEEQTNDFENEVFMKLKSDEVYDNILSYKKRTVDRFLLTLQNCGVSLIVTSEKVPDFIFHTCDVYSIVVVSCVEQEDIEFLSFIMGILPITSVNDKIDEANICEIESYQQVVFTGKPMLKMVCSRELARPRGKSLFLYAPTDGLSQQLKSLIKKCFKVLSSFFQGNENLPFQILHPDGSSNFPDTHSSQNNMKSKENKSPDTPEYSNQTTLHTISVPEVRNAIGGGGYFEFLLAHLIERQLHRDTSVEKKAWADIAVKMLHSVPQALFRNLSPSSARFWDVCGKAKESLNSGKVVGFNPKGILCNTSEAGAADVLSVKIAVVFAALDLTVKLLRIDSIIGVKRHPAELNTAEMCQG